MTGIFMSQMDIDDAPILAWYLLTSETCLYQVGLRMAQIAIAMRHSQGVTMQYVALTPEDKAVITTRLAIAAYNV